MSSTKPIHLSNHARTQALIRGATEEEIVEAIRTGEWMRALRNKWQAKKQFEFGKPSPVNQQWYRFKTVEPIFVDELTEIVVVTVKVYYANREDEA